MLKFDYKIVHRESADPRGIDVALLFRNDLFELQESRFFKDNPKFKDPSELNFQLDTLSPAKDFGLIDYANLYPIDLNNYSHILDSGPDLGAYERKE